MAFSSGCGSGAGALWPRGGRCSASMTRWCSASAMRAVRDQVAGVQLNLDLVPGLAHLHAAADPVHRHRVAVGVHRDIAFHIHQALMQPVDFRNPRRQRFQMQPLDREQLARHRADMFLVSRVDLVAPLPRLLIQILPTGERAPGQKVVLDEMRTAALPAPSGWHRRARAPRSESRSAPQRRPSPAPEPSRVRVPRNTTTCVLSIMTRSAAPPDSSAAPR